MEGDGKSENKSLIRHQVKTAKKNAPHRWRASLSINQLQELTNFQFIH